MREGKSLQEVEKGADPDRFADPGVFRSLRFAPKQSSSIPCVDGKPCKWHCQGPSICFICPRRPREVVKSNAGKTNIGAGLQLDIVSFPFSSSVSIGSAKKRSEKKALSDIIEHKPFVSVPTMQLFMMLLTLIGDATRAATTSRPNLVVASRPLRCDYQPFFSSAHCCSSTRSRIILLLCIACFFPSVRSEVECLRFAMPTKRHKLHVTKTFRM
jgi:hypothetical protein